MPISKYKLGDLVGLVDERNSDGKYELDDVKGISIQKAFIETKANMDGVSLFPYILVKPDSFAYVTVTSRNGEKITIAHNTSEDTYIVSSSYVVFRITAPDLILSDYLFMFFNRPEFDRYSRFNSWGSARETFSWEDFCDIQLELPSIDIQQKYVDLYNAALRNQQCYERGLEDLKLVCEGYIDKLRSSVPLQRIGDYIELSEATNADNAFKLNDVRGVSIGKKFIDTKADMQGVSLAPYLLVRPEDFAYVTVTSRNGEKISLAYNDSTETYICSSSYIVFRSKDHNTLFPGYLRMYFERSEFNRYARFNSWGSARETFDYSEMKDVKIPMPSIEVQKSIAEIFSAYNKRKDINNNLKLNLKSLCPILIKGSILEAGKQ